MSPLEQHLEQELLELGTIERGIIQSLPDFVIAMREAYRQGNTQEAERLDRLIDAAKLELRNISPLIAAIENKLYALRRKKR